MRGDGKAWSEKGFWKYRIGDGLVRMRVGRIRIILAGGWGQAYFLYVLCPLLASERATFPRCHEALKL